MFIDTTHQALGPGGPKNTDPEARPHWQPKEKLFWFVCLGPLGELHSRIIDNSDRGFTDCRAN